MTRLVLALAISFLAASAYAGIGENFEKASVGLSGSGEIFLDLDEFMSPANDDLYTTLRLDPTVWFYPWDRLAWSLSPRLRFENNIVDSAPETWLMFGASTALRYNLVMDPDASSGPSLAFSLGVGADVWRFLGDQSVWLYYYLDPTIILYYFVTERIAPFLSLDPVLLAGYWTNDSAGAPLVVALRDQLELTLSVRIGISFHFPYRDRTLDPDD